MENPANHTNIPSIEQWADHLEGLFAGPMSWVPINGTDQEKRAFISSFRDEFGSRRATDRALLSRVLGIGYERGEIENGDLDYRLWDSLAGSQDAWIELISEREGLVDPHGYAIEHRTLIELCALHAFWHLSGDTMRERVDDLIDWHTRELQPDNGINRPWGIHAFVVRSIQAESEELRLNAMLHAQTLANNCCITLGQPDILSAIILHDSTNALRSLITNV